MNKANNQNNFNFYLNNFFKNTKSKNKINQKYKKI